MSSYNKIFSNIIPAVAAMTMAVCATSCIENDIPYARVEVGFTAISAEGEASPAVINSDNREITLTLGEQVNPRDVKITDYKLSEGASLSADITGGIDLTSPYRVTVSLYQDYEWVIKAVQPIERYFTVEEQMGNSYIDVNGKRVIVNMVGGFDLTEMRVTGVKLGPADVTTMTPDLNNTTVDMSQPVEISVEYHGVTEKWTVYANAGASDVELNRIDAWTRVMWIYASTQEGSGSGFEYRAEGSEDWVRVDESAISRTGGEMSACVTHLEPNTTYEVRAYSSTSYSAAMTATTEGEITLPNMGFEDWWLDNKVWQPWAEGGTSFWDTGNDGAASFASIGLGGSITTPDSDTWNGLPGKSAKLETDYIVVKLAGGNIFAGEYVRTDGTNGVLNFGREFKGRPTRLHGHWKYTSTTISRSSDDAFKYLLGRPDTAHIYVALINSSTPVEIRTNPSSRQLFDRNADYVIAFGEMMSGETISTWSDFDVNLDYRRTDAVPNYIVIVATASKYADYFTGGEGSTLWLDDLSLEWDY